MIKNQNNDVDEVSIGTAIMIFGLLLILFAPYFSYFTYTPREITGYEDKTIRIPEYVSPIFFISVGILTTIIGCALFSKHFVNTVAEGLGRRRDENSHQ